MTTLHTPTIIEAIRTASTWSMEHVSWPGIITFKASLPLTTDGLPRNRGACYSLDEQATVHPAWPDCMQRLWQSFHHQDIPGDAVRRVYSMLHRTPVELPSAAFCGMRERTRNVCILACTSLGSTSPRTWRLSYWQSQHPDFWGVPLASRLIDHVRCQVGQSLDTDWLDQHASGWRDRFVAGGALDMPSDRLAMYALGPALQPAAPEQQASSPGISQPISVFGVT